MFENPKTSENTFLTPPYKTTMSDTNLNHHYLNLNLNLPPPCSPSSSSSSSSCFSGDLCSIDVNWGEFSELECQEMVKTRTQVEKTNLFNKWDQRLRLPSVKKNVARFKVVNRDNGGVKKKPRSKMKKKISNWKKGLQGCGGVKKNGVALINRNGGALIGKNGDMVKQVRASRPVKPFEERVKDWVKRKVESGVPESECRLPCLEKDPPMVQCNVCFNKIYSNEVICSKSWCGQKYHLNCAKEKLGYSSKRKFMCPKHDLCIICKQKKCWHCIRCSVAAHTKCAPWSDRVRLASHLKGQPKEALCWRHPSDWRLDKKDLAPTKNFEEIFCRLPLPYVEEEFSIDAHRKEMETHPKPFVRIRRNIYLCKKKHNLMGGCSGCTNCDPSGCREDCVCRVQCVSCSKECVCSETCRNRPFRKDKKVKVAKTEHCGWGIEAAEPIEKGEFVIEYVGEVIDDALCVERLWSLSQSDEENFYLCEIRKDFTIDATYKGNLSRFLNHSCDPNCIMEKWEVDGETRVGIFAIRSIEGGEPLTYDYRFVCFGTEVTCQCGSSNCRGKLGTKRNDEKKVLSWHSKRRRSPYSWET